MRTQQVSICNCGNLQSLHLSKMFKPVFYLLFGLLLFSCHAKKASIARLIVIDTTPTALTTGLLDMSQIDAMNAVAKNYGFHYTHVGGCVNPKRLSDSIRAVNTKIYEKLTKRYGSRWLSRFFSQVEIIRGIQFQIKELLTGSAEIYKTNGELRSQGIEVLYEILPSLETHTITVNAYGGEKIDGQFYKAIYYRVLVDPSKSDAIKLQPIK
jgi:hypothetical protein